mmetsp:Transcript_5004/g.12253  ORF Transcript_5004/g.12253 Transcript_5004/m.12253 type:complete len:525 (+) Transcript_5004:798-2372(+)
MRNRKDNEPSAEDPAADAVVSALGDLAREYGPELLSAALASLGIAENELYPKSLQEFPVPKGSLSDSDRQNLLRKKAEIYDLRRQDACEKVAARLASMRAKPRRALHFTSSIKDPRCASLPDLSSVASDSRTKQRANFEKFFVRSNQKIQGIVSDLLKEKQNEEARHAKMKASAERLAAHREARSKIMRDRSISMQNKLERMAEKAKAIEERQEESMSEMQKAIAEKFARSDLVKQAKRSEMEERAKERLQKQQRVRQHVRHLQEQRLQGCLTIADRLEQQNDALTAHKEQLHEEIAQRQQERSEAQMRKQRELALRQRSVLDAREQAFLQSQAKLDASQEAAELLLQKKRTTAGVANRNRETRAKERLQRSQDQWDERVQSIISRRDRVNDQVQAAAKRRWESDPALRRERSELWRAAQSENVARIARAMDCAKQATLYKIASEQRTAALIRQQDEDVRRQKDELTREVTLAKEKCSSVFKKLNHETSPSKIAAMVKQLNPSFALPVDVEASEEDGREDKPLY